MSKPAAKPSAHAPWLAAAACAVAGGVIWQFFGNASHGYVNTDSMFWWWVSQWLDPAAETEHGWLILGLSGWLLWRNFREGRSLLAGDSSGNRSYKTALVAMVVGLALHAIGFAVQQTRVSIVGFLIFTWGVLRFTGGKRWGRAAAFPLGFMAFAIPLNAFDTVGFWLRMWVIDASAGLAHTAGIGVLQSGTQLVAPDGRYNYDVAAACSGVRSLTALAALSLLAGYLNFRSWRRRAAVLLLCFPLVYLGNVARISSIVFAAQWGGQVWGERTHTVMGYGVFAIVLGGVLGAVSAMQRWWPEGGAGVSPASSGSGIPSTGSGQAVPLNQNHRLEADATPTAGGTPALRFNAWIVAAAIVVVAVGEMFFLHHLATLPPRGATGVVLAADEKNPADLPAFLGIEWTGRPVAVTPIEREILPADTGFARKLYFSHRDPSKQVFLSIVLSGRDRTSIHRPELCLVGQGWTITGRSTHRFNYPARTEANFLATLLQVRREMPTPRGPVAVPQLTAYWFVSSDAAVATHWERFAHDAWNRLVHARADRWAYVLMQTDATDGEAAALARMQAVLREALPAFQRPVKSP